MKELRDAIVAFVASVERKGGLAADVLLGDAERQRLQKALTAAIAVQRRIAYFLIALSSLALVGGVLLAWSYREDADVLVRLAPLTGLSVSVPFVPLAAVARLLWRRELVAALLPTLDDRAAAKVVKQLLQHDGSRGKT